MLTMELCAQANPDTYSHGQGQEQWPPVPTETATVFPGNPSFLKSSFDSCNLSNPLGERVLQEKFQVKSSPVT